MLLRRLQSARRPRATAATAAAAAAAAASAAAANTSAPAFAASLRRAASSASPSSAAPRSVAVVGSGPSGFYTAKYLLKEDPLLRVDVLDILPSPFGLVRSGVAPDHPEVKQVTNDFEAVAAEHAARFSFLGNVAVGKDVSVAELRERYAAVVLAYGAASDRAMGLEGEASLRNVFSARAFVNWYNGHPDFVHFRPNLDCEDVVIVGQGNVAVDCARILAKTVDELKATDIARHALEALAKSKVRRVHVVGRRGHVQAAFTMKELREVTRLEDAACVVHAGELARGRAGASAQELEAQRARKRMDALLAEVAAAAAARAGAGAGAGEAAKRRELVLRFLLSPSRLVADAADATAVGAVEFDVTRLEGAAEKQSAVATGEKEVIRAGMVLRSIGYKSEPRAGVPFDARRSVVPNEQGRVVRAAGAVERERGLYVSGWLKRGPSGIIGTNITDARETVACVLADQSAGELGAGTGGGAALRALLAARGKPAARLVEWPAWMRVDAEERRRGEAAGKSREKVVDVAEAIRVANQA